MISRQRLTRAISIMIMALVFAGCASNTDIRVVKPIKSETLSQKTFTWARGGFVQMARKGFGDSRISALREAIIGALSDKGYVMVRNPMSADLIVAVNVDGDFNADLGRLRTSSKLATAGAVNTSHYPRTPAGRRRRAADLRVNAASARHYSGKRVDAEVEGTVIIDIKDGSTKNDLWRGRIRKTIELSELREFEGEIGEDVAKLFKNFPVSQGN